jgi:hypothetical protein
MTRPLAFVATLLTIGVLLAQAPPPVKDPPVKPQSEWPQVDYANPASVDAWRRAQWLPGRQKEFGGRLWGPGIEEAPKVEPETWLGWVPHGAAFVAAPPKGLAGDWEADPRDLMIRVYGDRWTDYKTAKVQPDAKMPDDAGWCWVYDLHRSIVFRLPAATLVRPAARFRFVVDYGR